MKSNERQRRTRGGDSTPVRLVSGCNRDGSAITPSVKPYVFKSFLTLVSIVFPAACSPQPQTHPVDTAPIPGSARIVEQCSTLGNMLCGAVSMLSGETAVERRPACMAYTESSGRRVEQCGSLPASQSSSPPTRPLELKKTAHLSWKDNSGNETGFRIYRITGNQKIKIAELGPNTTTYIDKDAPSKACYLVVAFNSGGESFPTSKACLPD